MMKDLTALRQKIHGPVFSILTPFREQDDEIDFPTLERYLHQIYDAGGRIFYVMGYNSRYSQLSWDEIKELNAFVTKTVKGIDADNIAIVADPLHCSTKVSVEFAKHAQEIGADLISIICRERFYFEDQIYNHYKMITDAVEIGILVHEMPFLNGYGGPPVKWPVSLLDRVADIPNVIAVKEDAKDDDYSRAVIEKIRDRVAIVISGGGLRQWLRFSEMGCQAWLDGIGVFEPRLEVLFYQYYQEGKVDKYQEMIDQIEVPFFEEGVNQFGWHLVIKAALQARGIMSRRDRMPLQELPEEQYQEVKALIQRLPIQYILTNVELK